MLPLASSGSWRVSSILTSVPPRSKNSAALPFGSAIEKDFSLRAARSRRGRARAQNLVEDFDAGVGLRFGDDERRVDAHRGKVAHREQPALERLLEKISSLTLRRAAVPWSSRSRTRSMPMSRPLPRTSPMNSYFSLSRTSRRASSRRPCASSRPACRAESCLMVVATATAASGLPP
jgi:hypothetical protein